MLNKSIEKKSGFFKILMPVAITGALFVSAVTGAQAANITEEAVNNYADSMRQAANSKNLSAVSKLVADDALISLSRKGRTTSLDKSAYLNLLQNSWSQTSNYQYDIKVSNVVTSGSQAKADVVTTEQWVKDGKPTKLTTSSRATLKADENNAILLRAVAQVTIQ